MKLKSKKIAFIQTVIPNYKVALFKRLTKDYGIDFYVGDKNNDSVAPNSKDLEFIKGRLKNYFFKFLGIDFLIQTGFGYRLVKYYDLIIIPISVPFFLNWYIIFLSKFLGVKVAMYGMGINYQKKHLTKSSLLEKLRIILYKNTEFAVVYTEEIKGKLIEDYGIPASKIYVAQNTLDIKGIIEQTTDSCYFKSSFGINSGDILITYFGRLSSQKDPLVLIDVVNILDRKGFKCKLLYIGEGYYYDYLYNLSISNKNIIVVGQKSEKFVTDALKSSDFSIIPKMTGLAVVHSFAAGTCYITTDSDIHSPEFDYIENGKNAFVVEHDPEVIANLVESLIIDKSKRDSVTDAALLYAKNNLSLDNQVQAFNNALRNIGML